MGSPYVFDYRGEFHFADVNAELLWDKLARPERYHEWWPWMRDLETRGKRLEPGSEFDFVVVSPLPYRMGLTVRITESIRPTRVEADVDGHLRGSGAVQFRDEGDGTWAEVSWSVEVIDKAMRVGARIARPLIKWGQDWAIRVALRNFNRHLIAETSSK
jgi:hypothetical protein